jgi:hypothetical protein
MEKVAHLAEASVRSCEVLKKWLEGNPQVPRAALIEDVGGTLSVAIWGRFETSPEAALANPEVGGRFWSGRVLRISTSKEALDSGTIQALNEDLGEELMRYAQPVAGTEQRLWIAHRFRSRGHWFSKPQSPPWTLQEGPGIVVFYSYKGGTGRSTALASVAIQLARTGKRLTLIDADLDAPGIASSFLPEGAEASDIGVVDYLLDSMTQKNLDPTPYSWVCRRPELSGDGEIVVIPAGNLDANYPARLARLSFDPEPGSSRESFSVLLERTRDVFKPDWILVDARTGFTDMAAMILAGLGHLHVLCGTGSKQTWQGLSIVIDHLGRQRLQFGLPQADCLLVHTMVPREEVGDLLKERFMESAWDCFSEHFYADDDDARRSGLYDLVWTVDDAEQDANAPHRPLLVRYDSGLAAYSDLALVAPRLIQEPGLAALAERIQTWAKEQRLPSSGRSQ